MHRLRAITAGGGAAVTDLRCATRSPRCGRGRALHAELVRYGLVAWTAGNVSGPGARAPT